MTSNVPPKTGNAPAKSEKRPANTPNSDRAEKDQKELADQREKDQREEDAKRTSGNAYSDRPANGDNWDERFKNALERAGVSEENIERFQEEYQRDDENESPEDAALKVRQKLEDEAGYVG